MNAGGTQSTLRGQVFADGRILQDAVVVWQAGRILEVDPAPGPTCSAPVVEGTIVPGFVDLHVHGGAGFDFMDASAEAVRAITAYHARQGTAAMAATTLSAPDAAIDGAIQSIVEGAKNTAPDAADILGIHLEGPYLNPQRAGAQDLQSIRPPDADRIQQWLERAPHLAWRLTAAPEIPGLLPVIRRFRDRMAVCIGHTSATYAQCQEALEAGASHFTHLFNAMAPLHHREPGPIGAAMNHPTATAELIADGQHVHPALLSSMTRLMPDRVVLVTDAMRACGMPDGTYTLFRHTVTVRDGAARLQDGTLAGSVLTMAQAVANMVHLAGLPLESVLPLATEIPAGLLQAGDRKGRLQAGFDADLLVLGKDLRLQRVLLRGQEVHRS